MIWSMVCWRISLPHLGQWGAAHPGPQKTEIVVDLRHRAHGGPGIFAGGLLVDGDGGETVDVVHIGLFPSGPETSGRRTKGLHIAALPLGIYRIESQRGLARAGQAGDHHQLIPGMETSIFFKLLARAPLT